MTNEELKEYLEQFIGAYSLRIYISDDIEDVACQITSIGFSEAFYLEHKSVVDAFVKKYCENMSPSFFTLDSPYFNNKEIWEIIRDNHALKEIEFSGCELSKEAFDIMKENPNISMIDSSSVCPELRDCYDRRLGAVVRREIHGILTVGDLLYSDDAVFYGELTEAELDDICQLLPKRKAHGTVSFRNIKNGCNIKKIIDEIDKLEQDSVDKTHYKIKILDRDSFLYDVFTDEKQNSRIQVFTALDEATDMNDFIQTENKIRELFGNYKSYKDKLSPLERVILLHKVVSSFRTYKKENVGEDWRISRLLHKFLFSDRIVCAGFSLLLSELGERFDLPILYLDSTMDNSICDEYNHMNNIVFLDDDKYDVHGVYLLDATADNTQSDIFVFNNCLLTPEELRHHSFDLYTESFSLLDLDDFDFFSERIKNHSEELVSLVLILSKVYPEHPVFQELVLNRNFENYYLMHLEDLFQMSRDIKIAPIRDEQFIQAITHLEKTFHPELNEDQIEEKVQVTMDFYHQRNQKMFGDTNRTPLVIQKKL